MAFDGNHRSVGIRHRLTFCRLTYHTGTVFLKRYYGRGGSCALRVGDYNGFASLHYRYARIRGTEIDTDYFSCHNYHAPYIIRILYAPQTFPPCKQPFVAAPPCGASFLLQIIFNPSPDFLNAAAKKFFCSMYSVKRPF